MEEDAFNLEEEVSFNGADTVKSQLVSEIDMIRDAMVMVNMFMGEPFKIGATLLQELQQSPRKNNNE